MVVQLQQITDVITPLLETFSVGILQNPYAFEALQNFTTSTGTQALLSALRNATDEGLPLLQRILVGYLSCLCKLRGEPAQKVDATEQGLERRRKIRSCVCIAGHCQLLGQHHRHSAV